MSNIGFATLQVIPSLKGLDRQISGQITGPLGSAGGLAGERASRSFGSKFKTGLTIAGITAGAALTSGLGAAFAILKTGGQEASDASAGLSQLKAGIKSTGNVAGVSVPQLEGLASSIQGFSGQTDDSIVASEQLLLTFTNIRNAAGKGNDIFNQATLATANLAAKMGGDASTSAIQLGKALNDPVKGITALTRVGVSFTQGQKDQIKALVAAGDTMGAQKIILKELNTEFGGAAKAAGQSVPGQLARAKRSFEDLSQGIVETLLPIALPAVQALSSGLQKLAPVAAQAAGKVTAGLSSLASKAVAALSQVDFSSFFAAVRAGVQQILPSLQAFGAQLVDLFVGHLLPLFVQFARVVLPVVVDIGGKLAQIFTGSIIPAFAELVDFATAHVIPIVAAIADKLSSFLGFLAEHQGAVKTFAKVALGLLVARFAALKVKAAVDGVKSFVSNVKAGIETTKKFAGQLGGFASKLGSASSKMLTFGKNTLKATANIAKQTAAFIAQKGAAAVAAAAQKLLAGAQLILNAAMDANPVFLIIAGIALLAAGIFIAYKKFKPFRDIVDAVGRAFRSVFDWVKSNWPKLLLILTGPFGLAIVVFKRFGPQILSAVTSAFGAVFRFFSSLPAKIIGALGAIGSLLVDIGKRILGGLITGARAALGLYLDFYVKLPLKILGKLADAASWLLGTGKKVIGGFFKGLVVGAVAVFQWVGRLELRVLGALGAVATWLLGAGVKVISGLLRGIVDGSVNVFGFFVRLPGRILDLFVGAGRWLVDIGKGILIGLGNGIVEGTGAVLGWLGGLKDRFLGAIGDARRWLFDIGHNIIGGLLDGIKSAFGAVKDFLGGTAGKVIHWVNPPPAEGWLRDIGKRAVEGLSIGFDDQLPSLQRQLGDVSKMFAKTNLDFGLPRVVAPVKAIPFSPQQFASDARVREVAAARPLAGGVTVYQEISMRHDVLSVADLEQAGRAMAWRVANTGRRP